MNNYEKKLVEFIHKNHINAEHLVFQTSCHSVEEAASSANASPEDFVKNVCIINETDNFLIVCIIPGHKKLDLKKLAAKVGTKKLRFATAEEILHFLRPFNPDEIKKIEGKMVNHLNEGATLYYLHQAYPDFDFFEKIKNPTNRGEAGHLRYLIYNVWKTWVEQHGEERMAASYFGRRKFPREVAKEIANGLIKEMFAATAKMLN